MDGEESIYENTANSPTTPQGNCHGTRQANNESRRPQSRGEHILDDEDYFDVDQIPEQDYISYINTQPTSHEMGVVNSNISPPTTSSAPITTGSRVDCPRDTTHPGNGRHGDDIILKSVFRNMEIVDKGLSLEHVPSEDHASTYGNVETAKRPPEDHASIYGNVKVVESKRTQLTSDPVLVKVYPVPVDDQPDYENDDVIDKQLFGLLSQDHASLYGNLQVVNGKQTRLTFDPVPVDDQPDYENHDVIDEQLFGGRQSREEKLPILLTVSDQSDYRTVASGVEHPLLKAADHPLFDHTHNERSFETTWSNTLHRESEMMLEPPEPPGNKEQEECEDTGEGNDCFNPISLNLSTASPDNISGPTHSHEPSLMLIERVKSSRGSAYPKAGQCKHVSAAPDLSELGSFERALLQGPSSIAMPSVKEIPWYHDGINRHISEALLLSKAIKDGTYLLRDSVQSNKSLTLSVRYQNSVKHYRILWEGKQFCFGLGKFTSVEALKEHFQNQPVISGESGILVQLSYPYPRGVAEPAIYFEPVIFPGSGSNEESTSVGVVSNDKTTPTNESITSKKWTKKNKSGKTSSSTADLSINSKEGYLVKLGYRVKNWKKRWFVLYRNELKYFYTQDAKDPLKVIDLQDVLTVSRDDSAGKPHCFKVATSYRTFFIHASSDVEANEWVQILDWKLVQRSRSNSKAN